MEQQWIQTEGLYSISNRDNGQQRTRSEWQERDCSATETAESVKRLCPARTGSERGENPRTSSKRETTELPFQIAGVVEIAADRRRRSSRSGQTETLSGQRENVPRSGQMNATRDSDSDEAKELAE